MRQEIVDLALMFLATGVWFYTFGCVLASMGWWIDAAPDA